MLLVAEAFSRGNIKTEGFQSRIVAVPEDMVQVCWGPERPRLRSRRSRWARSRSSTGPCGTHWR